MPWKEVNIEALAKSLGINVAEVREKQKLIQSIVEARTRRHISQAKLAKMVGVTQGRIAQIESGIGTAKLTFDVLFNILTILNYEYRITLKKVA